MFTIVGEYKGIIKNGFILAGENFFPGRKRTVTVDREQLERLTQGEENGWFVIHSCKPENPFLKAKAEEAKAEEVKAEEVKAEAPKKKATKSKKKVEEVAE